MRGQGQLKVQVMSLRDPGEKGENLKAVIFTTNSIVSVKNFTRSSMVLFSSFGMAYFCQKTNLIFLYGHFQSFWTIHMKGIFEPIDFKFAYIYSIFT